MPELQQVLQEDLHIKKETQNNQKQTNTYRPLTEVQQILRYWRVQFLLPYFLPLLVLRQRPHTKALPLAESVRRPQKYQLRM